MLQGSSHLLNVTLSAEPDVVLTEARSKGRPKLLAERAAALIPRRLLRAGGEAAVHSCVRPRWPAVEAGIPRAPSLPLAARQAPIVVALVLHRGASHLHVAVLEGKLQHLGKCHAAVAPRPGREGT